MKTTLTVALLTTSLCLTACGAELDSGPVEANFSSLYNSYLQKCSACHIPAVASSMEGIETSLDFTSVQTAYKTITTGKASGLTNNQEACNGVAFIDTKNPAKSLLVASIDKKTRASFDLGASGCDESAITDMNIKLGNSEAPDGFVAALLDWIKAGAKND